MQMEISKETGYISITCSGRSIDYPLTKIRQSILGQGFECSSQRFVLWDTLTLGYSHFLVVLAIISVNSCLMDAEPIILKRMNGPQRTAVSRKELWQKMKTKRIFNHLTNKSDLPVKSYSSLRVSGSPNGDRICCCPAPDFPPLR